MVKTGKFLENSIDLYNSIVKNVRFVGNECSSCDFSVLCGNRCTIFDKYIESSLNSVGFIRCEDCIRIFGEKSNG